eukprot:snap_masked-scaffold_46-processed-gene-1.10-mRNA-1 protein AED:1.00 eAED:1.00 QI:0/0/0/0/1/1/3/0/926
MDASELRKQLQKSLAGESRRDIEFNQASVSPSECSEEESEYEEENEYDEEGSAKDEEESDIMEESTPAKSWKGRMELDDWILKTPVRRDVDSGDEEVLDVKYTKFDEPTFSPAKILNRRNSPRQRPIIAISLTDEEYTKLQVELLHFLGYEFGDENIQLSAVIFSLLSTGKRLIQILKIYNDSLLRMLNLKDDDLISSRFLVSRYLSLIPAKFRFKVNDLINMENLVLVCRKIRQLAKNEYPTFIKEDLHWIDYEDIENRPKISAEWKDEANLELRRPSFENKIKYENNEFKEDLNFLLQDKLRSYYQEDAEPITYEAKVKNTITAEEFLSELSLEQYLDNFLYNGWDDSKAFQYLKDEDLVQMGIFLPGHRRKIMENVYTLQENFYLPRGNGSFSLFPEYHEARVENRKLEALWRSYIQIKERLLQVSDVGERKALGLINQGLWEGMKISNSKMFFPVLLVDLGFYSIKFCVNEEQEKKFFEVLNYGQGLYINNEGNNVMDFNYIFSQIRKMYVTHSCRSVFVVENVTFSQDTTRVKISKLVWKLNPRPIGYKLSGLSDLGSVLVPENSDIVELVVDMGYSKTTLNGRFRNIKETVVSSFGGKEIVQAFMQKLVKDLDMYNELFLPVYDAQPKQPGRAVINAEALAFALLKDSAKADFLFDRDDYIEVELENKLFRFPCSVYDVLRPLYEFSVDQNGDQIAASIPYLIQSLLNSLFVKVKRRFTLDPNSQLCKKTVIVILTGGLSSIHGIDIGLEKTFETSRDLCVDYQFYPRKINKEPKYSSLNIASASLKSKEFLCGFSNDPADKRTSLVNGITQWEKRLSALQFLLVNKLYSSSPKNSNGKKGETSTREALEQIADAFTEAGLSSSNVQKLKVQLSKDVKGKKEELRVEDLLEHVSKLPSKLKSKLGRYLPQVHHQLIEKPR